MARLPLIFRFLILLLAFSAPLAGIGALVFGWKGAAAGFLLGDLLVLLVAFSSEAILIRAFQALPGAEQGIDATFQAVLRGIEAEWGGAEKLSPPRLLVYADPMPNSATLRALGSPGAVLVSQGLLGQLTEAELRSVLRGAVLRLEEPEWAFSSLCASLAALLIGRAPSNWIGIFFCGNPGNSAKTLSPLTFVVFLCFYPWIRLFMMLSSWVPAAESDAESWLSAIRKITSRMHASGHVAVPAAAKLFLVDPTPAGQLIRPT